MRRYLQGTLDYACGIYAVINALAWLRGLDLAGARRLFQEAHLDIAAHPALYARYMRNETDHYWVVRYMLARACLAPPYRLEMTQPYADGLIPDQTAGDLELSQPRMYLPESEQPFGPASLKAAVEEAGALWQVLLSWFASGDVRGEKLAAILRFHRFLPGFSQPVVSHWTTARNMAGDTLLLYDASSEQGALMEISRQSLLPQGYGRALLRIVPESLLLLRAIA